MNQAVQKQTSLFGSVDLEKISLETGIALWEIEYAVNGFRDSPKHKTIKIARAVYEESRLGSRERFEAKLDLDNLCFDEIQKDLTFEEIIDVINTTTPGSPVHRLALQKALEAANRKEHFQSLILKIVNITDPIRICAIKKIVELNTNCV